jgi:hypothetical protein
VPPLLAVDGLGPDSLNDLLCFFLAFELAFTTVAPPAATTEAAPSAAECPEADEPIPVCCECGSLIGIFPDHGLQWQHFRGGLTTSATQQIHDPGHPPAATWLLPGEEPADL